MRPAKRPKTAIPLNELIRSRRSVRRYSLQKVSHPVLKRILEAGRWAPSGLNNQPWKFILVRDKQKHRALSYLTVSGSIIRAANALIVVCMDHSRIYNRDKDCMAIGACIQNMLLQAHAEGLGGCWLGEILKRKKEAAALLSVPAEWEVMAVLTLGYPLKKTGKGARLSFQKLVTTI